MKALFVLAILVLLTGCASTTNPSTETTPCPDRGELATFGVDGRNEDYLRSCFPCCFCCEGPGSCCDECKAKNLTSKKSPSNE